MSKLSFQELKERFKKQEAEKQSQNNGERKFKNNSIYPFWEMNIGEHAVTRILPDKNEDNPNGFFLELLEHTLSIDGKDQKITCLKTYGELCPICDLSAKYYKAKDSVKGKYFYRKKTNIVRLLVLKDPLPVDPETKESAEGKVKTARFGFQLMEKIKIQIADELESEPWDFKEGYDFVIKKSLQGKDDDGKEQTSYALGSGFARKATPIDDKYLADLELVDLSTLLPKNPGKDKVQRMLESHLNGTPFDDSETTTSDASVSTSSTPTQLVTPTEVALIPPISEEPDSPEDEDDAIIRRIMERRANGGK